MLNNRDVPGVVGRRRHAARRARHQHRRPRARTGARRRTAISFFHVDEPVPAPVLDRAAQLPDDHLGTAAAAVSREPMPARHRRRRRHPVGRRGQGQDRRPAHRARRRRGALPGRPQRRPHAGHRRREDRRCTLIPSGMLHARRQSASSATAWCVDPEALLAGDRRARARGRADRYDAPAHQPRRAPDPAVPRRARPRARARAQRRQRKIGTTGRGIGPAYEDKVGAPRDARLQDLLDAATLRRRKLARAARAAQLRAAQRTSAPSRSTSTRMLDAARGARAERLRPLVGRRGALAARSDRGGPARAVRGRAGRAARRRPRHLSVRDVVATCVAGGGGARAPASARRASTTCSAS